MSIPNLAGHPSATAACSAELLSAGITLHTVDPGTREVPSAMGGTLGDWSFRRAWRYWIAYIDGPGIPRDKAIAFNKLWGSEVRVGGYAGGTSVQHAYGSASHVGSYHINTAAGLKAFAELLRSL